MSADYTRLLDHLLRAFVHVEFKTVRRDIVDYAIVLLVEVEGELKTVRLYDGAHDENELHRYTREGTSSRPRSSIAVPLGKGCAPRSRRSSADTKQ
jgi:hypothetical protein